MSQSMHLGPYQRYGVPTVNHTNSRTVPAQQTQIIGYVHCTVFVPAIILPGVNQPLPHQLLPGPNHFQGPAFSTGQMPAIHHSPPVNSLVARPSQAPIAPIPQVEVLNPSENPAPQFRPQLTTNIPNQSLSPCQAPPSIDIFVPPQTADTSGSPRQEARENPEQNEVMQSPAPVSSDELTGQARETSEQQNETMESPSSLSSSERAAISLNHTRWLEESVIYTAGAETFPMRLHRLLAELELTAGGRSIAEFQAGGRSFLIKDKKQLLSTVLPKFFPKMKSYASFQRQLNLYNFKRTGGLGRNRSSYRHQFFIRASPAMSILMKPIKLKRGAAYFSNKKYPPRKLQAEAQPRTSTEE